MGDKGRTCQGAASRALQDWLDQNMRSVVALMTIKAQDILSGINTSTPIPVPSPQNVLNI